jgi:hypothetical protein
MISSSQWEPWEWHIADAGGFFVPSLRQRAAVVSNWKERKIDSHGYILVYTAE